MIDNSSAHPSYEYDEKISNTIPCYEEMHKAAIELVIATEKPIYKWLDTGCGTGAFCQKAIEHFSGAQFVLADPSEEMLKKAEVKLEGYKNINFFLNSTQSLSFEEGTFDVITAIQCHHYLHREERIEATINCCRMLKKGGIFITFENIAPLTNDGEDIGLRRWKQYQIRMGKTDEEAQKHILRYGNEYFPISIIEHLDVLKNSGFSVAEMLSYSYMQAGFYAIKLC